MPKRINIEPRTNGAYQISQHNPNPGGQTLESPYGKGEDLDGPFIVFPRSHVTTSGRAVLPVVSAGTLKAALLYIEKGGEVGQVGSARPEDSEFGAAVGVGTPDEPQDYTALRLEYQSRAAREGLAELPSWDEFLAERGYEPGKTSAAGLTRETAQSGIDPDAKALTEVS